MQKFPQGQIIKSSLFLGILLFFLGLGFLIAFFMNLGENNLFSNSKLQGFSAQQAVEQAFQTCPRSADRSGSIVCFRNFLSDFVAQNGIQELLSALEIITKEESLDPSYCHDVVHALGQLGTEHQSVQETVVVCTDLCTYGCHHGAVEQYVATETDPQKQHQLVSDVVDACKSSNRAACFHGLGHGVSVLGNYELPTSLALCNQVEEESDRMYCGEGVLMELYEPSTFDKPIQEFPEDIGAFCESLESPYHITCYRMVGSHTYQRTQNKSAAVTACKSIDQAFSGDCIAALSQNLYFMEQNNVGAVVEFCSQQTDAYAEDCLKGMLYGAEIAAQSSRKKEICEQWQEFEASNSNRTQSTVCTQVLNQVF